jgi:hypothetical protein
LRTGDSQSWSVTALCRPLPLTGPSVNSEAPRSTPELFLPEQGSVPSVDSQLPSSNPPPKHDHVLRASSPTGLCTGNRPRVVERGLLKYPGSGTFWIQAENFPLWLLGLDRSVVQAIHLMGGSDAKSYLAVMKSRGCDLSLINLVIGRIGLGKVRFSTLERPNPLDANAIVLVSGSLEYIRHCSILATKPTMVLCDDHIRGKVSKFGGSFRWFHLRHTNFGGPTAFKAFVGTNIEAFQPELTELRRSIAHILDHSIRPTVRTADYKKAIPASRLLHPHSLGDEVLYRSSFTSTGWGSRPLTADELGVAFGFPSWLRHEGLSIASFPVVPIQLLDGCLRGLLPQVTAKQPLPPIQLAPKPVASTKTWLPRLQKFLSHDWIDGSVVTSKAAKRDDAEAQPNSGTLAAFWFSRTWLPPCRSCVPV